MKTHRICNPLTVPFGQVNWLTAPVVLCSASELDFLRCMVTGSHNPLFADQSIARKLATLLRSYRVLGEWVSGTLGEYAIGGFRLAYLGDSVNAPEWFQISDCRDLAIIEVIHGKHRGYLCLKT